MKIEDDKMYLIGEASKICKISKKTLRYYSDTGVVLPDKIDEETGYRYYSKETLLNVPVLKYYKQMGFKLNEMKDVISGDTKSRIREKLADKSRELESLREELDNSYKATREWHELIKEAQYVVDHQVDKPSYKYLNEKKYCYLEQKFNYNYMESIINIEWVEHLEKHDNEISGAVILMFDSYLDKMNGESDYVKIMQTPLKPCKGLLKKHTMSSGLYANIYHIGPHKNIDESYKKLHNWINNKGYRPLGRSYERYLVDYWTTRNSNEFVTEILIPIQK